MILVVNPPATDPKVNRDMAGGLGYSGGAGVVLPPIDLLNIVATLKKAKYKVKFVDAVAENIKDDEFFVKLIRAKKIKTIISNLSLPTLSEDVEFAKRIKLAHPNISYVFKTGINYKNILEKALKDSRADQIIFGECDLSIGEYLRGSRTTASVFWDNGKIVFSPMTLEDRVSNLDDLPVSDRGVLKKDLYKYVLLKGRATTMQTSRGCPYPCGYYCPYPLVQGKLWRQMSVPRVIKEIKSIKKLGVNNILFRDATFTLEMDRIKKLCEELISKKIKIKWWCETRINVLNEELLIIMKKAGCQGINVGIETLDQELILSQGKPGVSLEAVTKIRDTARRLGLKLHFLMLVGLPNENLKTVLNTFNYLIDFNPESVGFSTITPYPGTEMFESAVKEGLISKFDWNKFDGSISNMRTKYLSQTDIKTIRLILLLTAAAMKRQWWVKYPVLAANKTFLTLWKGIRRE